MIPLEQIRVETPCGADWERMEGTDQVRFCAGCRKNVYNLSAMTRGEAQQSLEGSEGMPCVRFHHDTQGAPLTREALPGRRRFLAVLAGTLLAIIGGVVMPGAASEAAEKKSGALPSTPPPVMGGVPVMIGAPPPATTHLMGKIAPPKHRHLARPPHRKDKRGRK